MVVQKQEWTVHDTPAGRPDAFKQEGVVCARQVFTAAEVDEIRSTFVSQLADRPAFAHDDGVPKDDILARYPRLVHPHRHPETPAGRLARQYIIDKRLLDVAQSLIGPVHGAQSMFYFKPPTARGQALHQDNTSLRVHPETCMAAWIAIDDADGENGGLVVVPKSHHNDLLCLGEADQTTSFSSRQVKLPPDVVPCQTELRAGDVLFFHGALVHGSNPNLSTRFRRALIFHYIPQASQEVGSGHQCG